MLRGVDGFDAHAPQGHTVSKLVTWLSMKTTLDVTDDLPGEAGYVTGAQVTVTAAGLPLVAPSANAPPSQMTLADLLAMEQQAQMQEDAQRAGHPV